MRFSYSRLTSFEMCRLQWMLNYIHHEPRESGFFSEYGSFIHSILESHLKGEMSAEDALMHYLSQFDKVVTGRAPSQKMRASFFVQGAEYFENLDFPHKNIVSVEEELTFNIDGGDYVGYVDVISEDSDGGLIITDHKSRPLYPYSKNYKIRPTKADKDLDQYLRQQILYAYGIKQKYGVYPKALEFNSFRKQNLVHVPFEEAMIEPTLKWASTTRSQIIHNQDWKPNIDYWVCNHLCDVNKSCSYFERCRGMALG